MSNFKINQKVVVIEQPSTNGCKNEPRGIAPNVKPNTIHTVKAICYCSNCGRQKLDIGLIMPPSTNLTIRCSCDNRYPHNGRWFLDSSNFRPLIYENISAEIADKLKLIEEKSDVEIKETILQ